MTHSATILYMWHDQTILKLESADLRQEHAIYRNVSESEKLFVYPLCDSDLL